MSDAFHIEAPHTEAPHTEAPHTEAQHTDALHTDAVRVLSAYQPVEEQQRLLRADYLAFLAAHDDAMSRDCDAGHLTASTLLFDPTTDSVLLTLHARLGRWLQLGGHCEQGDGTLLAAAAREAAEESGIGDLRLQPVPVRLDRHTVPGCRDAHGASRTLDHLDVQYVAVCEPGAVAVISDESLDLRWWRCDDVPPDDAAVVALVAAARARV